MEQASLSDDPELVGIVIVIMCIFTAVAAILILIVWLLGKVKRKHCNRTVIAKCIGKTKVNVNGQDILRPVFQYEYDNRTFQSTPQHDKYNHVNEGGSVQLEVNPDSPSVILSTFIIKGVITFFQIYLSFQAFLLILVTVFLYLIAFHTEIIEKLLES